MENLTKEKFWEALSSRMMTEAEFENDFAMLLSLLYLTKSGYTVEYYTRKIEERYKPYINDVRTDYDQNTECFRFIARYNGKSYAFPFGIESIGDKDE